MNKTIYLYANPEFDERYKCGISRLYRIFSKTYNINIEIIDDEFLRTNVPDKANPETLVIAGGDGTMHRVINTIPDTAVDRYKIGIIAGGTANEFARSINIPSSFEEAAGVIAKGKRTISVKKGVINDEHYFLTGFLYGIACKVLEDTTVKSKFYLGAIAYQLPGLFSLSNYSKFVKQFVVDSKEFKTGYLLINSASLSSKTQNLEVIREEIKDYFSVIYLQAGVNTGDLLRLIINNQIGENVLQDPAIYYEQMNELSLKFDGVIQFMLDGEIYKMPSPLKFGHSNNELKIIAP